MIGSLVIDLVHLETPLPWKDQASDRDGEIFELSEHGLIISSADPPPAHLALTTDFGGGEVFSFAGQVTSHSPGRWHLEVTDGREHEKLQELLGQVRKGQHIRICRSNDVESSDRQTGFAAFNFIPNAMPEIALGDISTASEFLGRMHQAPILITGMTGGVVEGAMINRRLAQAAQKFAIPMGLGSQRVALDNPKYSGVFQVKDIAPDVFFDRQYWFCAAETS